MASNMQVGKLLMTTLYLPSDNVVACLEPHRGSLRLHPPVDILPNESSVGIFNMHNVAGTVSVRG